MSSVPGKRRGRRIDQFFAPVAGGDGATAKRAKLSAAPAAAAQQQEGGKAGGDAPWDDVEFPGQQDTRAGSAASAQLPQEDEAQQPPVVAGGSSAAQAAGAAVSSRESSAVAAAGTAASATAAAGGTKAPNAFGALMAAARGQQPPQQKQGEQQLQQPELSAQQMAERAASNQTAAAAAVADARAAGRHPPLASLLHEPSWAAVLAPEFDKPYMQQLQGFLEAEWASGTIYPPQDCIFRAFNAVPFDQVRVVILGQDPYINVGEAMGLAFSVPPGVRVPPSLANMYKELAADVGARPPNHGCLEGWCRQGVLLLNAALTVRPKQSNSHAGKGWEAFTSAALTALVKQRRGIVFLLWGKYAQDRCAKLDMRHHHVLKSVHPSPLSAHRGFLGCRHFSAANRLLQQAGHSPVEWQLENV